MFDPSDKLGFLNYISTLEIQDSTKRNYRTWVNRLDTRIKENLSAVSEFSESEVWRLADTLQAPFHKGHRKDARSMLRHYRRYRDEVAIQGFQQRLAGPSDPEAARKRVLRAIAIRRGQRQFRDALMREFGSRCVVTRTNDEPALEAAHIRPFAASGTSVVANGLLLRADIHVLFDLHLLTIRPDNLTVYCNSTIRHSAVYGQFHGKPSLLSELRHQVDLKALGEHFDETKG